MTYEATNRNTGKTFYNIEADCGQDAAVIAYKRDTRSRSASLTGNHWVGQIYNVYRSTATRSDRSAAMTQVGDPYTIREVTK